MNTFSPKTLKIATAGATMALIAATLVAAGPTATAATTTTQTFGYTGSTASFTVPAGVTQLTVSAAGAQGGRGGGDGAGPPPAGGYRGAVSGTISVTPGQVLAISVGQGGANGTSLSRGSNVPANFLVGAAVGGANPLNSYRGGNGGVAGPVGASGFGASGGAATVITTGGATIVAGGSGGSGGSGQFAPTLGRLPYATFTGRSDTTSTNGQAGATVAPVCLAIPGNNCDGGGGGGGGGGAQGGLQGTIEFGSGTSLEWFGYGGYPGQNATAGLSGLSAIYQYYSTNNGNGSVTLSYASGAPDAPTNVGGIAGDSSVALAWSAPAAVGESPVSDYVVEHATASAPTTWTTFSDGISTATSTTVTGLTNGVPYIFRVSAVNTAGSGEVSTSSSSVAPYGVPTAPVITALSPLDAGLSVAFTAAASGGPILNYEYQLDGSGPWISSAATSSPLTVNGLVNGVSSSVKVRAVNSIGAGPASLPMAGTPAAPAGAPNVTAVSTSIGTITVSFTPGYAGGRTISDYEYRLDSGPWISAATTSSPLTVTGLSDGTSYAIAIRAVTGVGSGVATDATIVTTPGVPAAPSITAVAVGDRSLSVAFSPGNSNGSTITAVQYQLTSGGPWTTAPSTASPISVSGLSNGTTYAVAVRAVNAVGSGPASSSQSATPATVPGAPVITGNTIAGSDQQLSAAFTPPASDGGSAITTYEYSTDAGATWRVRWMGTTSSPVVISTESGDGTTPLVNGVTYSVQLRAVNSLGAGQASAVADGIAQTTPDAPTITALTPGPASLAATITAGANGGAAVTAYEYRLGSGSWQTTGTLGSSFLVSGLTNGTSYAVSVRAVNSQGAGTASSSTSGTPRTVPGEPDITGVSRADRNLMVSVASGGTGGSAITRWDYSTDGGATWRSAGTANSPLSITHLSSDGVTRIANGSSYPVTVRAVNAAGAGAPSAITTVGPGTAPDAPSVALTPLNSSLQVGFTPGSDGGSPISTVSYRIGAGSWVDAGTLMNPFIISALTNGTAYSVQVRLDNALGAGPASTPSTATPRTVPNAPTGATALSNTASADVAWTAPVLNGGSAITSYIATAYDTPASGATVGTCTTSGTSCSITGLTNGTTYYVSVVAGNVAGFGQPSAPRVVVMPLARPGAPTLSSLAVGDTTLSATFTAGSAGSSAITSYQYRLNGGAWQNATGTTSPLVISGLTNGTSYTVALRAVNAAGPGPASSTRTATPFTFPDAPAPATIVANGVNGAAIVTWVAPNNNGSTITSYTATAFNLAVAGNPVGTACSTAALTCTITGLTNGVTYYISLQAQNTAGLSVRSAPRVAVTPSFQPGAVSGVTGASGNGQVSLSWTPGSTGASVITDYTLWYSSGGGYTQFSDGTSAAPTATVTGLTNGTAYTFLVYAVNVNGTGPASLASSPVTPLAPGVVPELSVPTGVEDGFDLNITNYSAGTTYVVTTTNGGTVTRIGSSITVRGLGTGGSSTTTVTASATGSTTTSAAATGTSLLAGAIPVFTSITRTLDGFTFDIANYDPLFLYTLSATNGATVTKDNWSVVVSGLAPGQSSEVSVGVSGFGYSNASGSVSGTAMDLGTAPDLVDVSSTPNGFTANIANYSPSLDYTFTATNGATITRSGSLLTVSGLSDGQASVITITVTDPGVSQAQASTTGTALLAGTAPLLSTPVSTDGGWTASITNYSPDYTYSVSATNGAAAILDGGNITVTGLAPGASSTLTVTANRSGHTTTSDTITGASLLAGIEATFTAPVSTPNGFTFEIANYDPDVTYEVLASSGAVVVRNGSLITVTGLDPSAASIVTIRVIRDGYSDVSTTVSASSSPDVTPSPIPTSTPTPSPTSTPTPTSTPSRTSTATPTATAAAAQAKSASAIRSAAGKTRSVDGVEQPLVKNPSSIDEGRAESSLARPDAGIRWWVPVSALLAMLAVLTGMILLASRRRRDHDDLSRTAAGTG